MKLMLHQERVTIANDDVDFEDHTVEEPKEKNQRDSKEDPPLEELQRKEDQHEDLSKTWKFVRDHPIDQVIRDPVQDVRTRGALKDTCEYAVYISQLEPKNFKKVENEESWILAMQEELGQFERNKVWTLVPRPTNYPIIGTKWIFRNKMDELGNVVRNKA